MEKNYSNGDTSKRIAVGQASNGIFHDYAEASFGSGERVNMTMHSEQATTGMVNSVTQDGPVYTAGLTDPGLFTDKAVSGKENVSGYSLSFNQEGDTYTLSSVKDENGNNTVDDLEKFKDIYDAKPPWSPNHKVIYSNNFWPLDKLQYAGKDINLGQKGVEYRITGNRYSTAGANAYQYEGWAEDRKTYLESDDGLAHNWFFGMRYDFDFTLGDYTGPLNYYFRGDDDFWLFIDGILAIDLGGIHSAVGKTLDLREFMNKYNMTDPDKTHRLTIIYAERGGSGSTCYMQFTIPNVTPVDVETTVEKTNVTIQKKWEDHGNPNRPSSVQVKLYYKGPGDTEWQYDESNGIKTLTEGNQWTATWTGLPKEGYSYKVEEVNVPDGYKVIYPDNSDAVYLPNNGSYEGEFTNKANPSTYITVIKKWDDGGLADQARPESVDFYLYYREKGSTTWLPYPADGRLTLTETDLQTDGTWKGVYDNLPVYGADNETLLEYTVKEVDGDSELIEGAYLPGKDDYQYTVHYPDDHYKDKNWKAYEAKADGETLNLTVTNSLGVSIKVNKEWKGYNPEKGTVIYAGLYKGGAPVDDKWVELNAGNSWTATFQYLPSANDYSVKELRKAESVAASEFTINGVGYIGVNSGGEASVGTGDTAIKYVISYSQLTQDTIDPSLSTITITNQAQWQLIKYSSSKPDKTLTLEGAEFELKNDDDNTVYKGESDAKGIVEWTKDGKEFTGVFPDGSYTLTETKAPTGYALGNSIIFTMKDGVPEKMGSDTGTVVDGIITFYYDNTAIYALPSSGGSGIYKYLFGGVLLMMAASLIVYKNKRREVLKRK